MREGAIGPKRTSFAHCLFGHGGTAMLARAIKARFCFVFWAFSSARETEMTRLLHSSHVPIRSHLLALLLCGLLASVAGCSKGSTSGRGSSTAGKRIVIITNVPDPFWDTCEAGANAAQRDVKLADAGISVAVEQNTKGVQGQIQRLREWAGDPSIVAVAVSVTEPDNTALIDAMKGLNDAGIKVITIDSDVNRDSPAFREVRYGYIGTDNVTAGEELGKAAKALLPDGGKFATFVGNKSQANAIQRDQGFKQGAGDKFEQVDFLADAVDPSKARQNVHDVFSRHDDLKLLVGLWAYNPPAIADVVAERGVGDKVTVLGFDAAPLALDAMGKGRIQALLVQDPYQMGYLGVKTLKALLDDDQKTLKEVFPQYGEPDGDIHLTNLKIVVPQDSPLTKDLFRETTQFQTLDEFNAWLKENHLTGS
jgi:ribose transport system substrate-binding protein